VVARESRREFASRQESPGTWIPDGLFLFKNRGFGYIPGKVKAKIEKKFFQSTSRGKVVMDVMVSGRVHISA